MFHFHAMKNQIKLGVVLAINSIMTGLGADFVNLNFSSPDLTGLQYDVVRDSYYGEPQKVVPGWRISQDLQPIDRVWVMEGGAYGPVTLNIFKSGSEAKFYVFSYDGEPAPQVLKSTTISQMATIPVWALSLEFVWDGDPFVPSPLKIDGKALEIRSDPGNPASYRSDISLWAGREVVLSFDFPRGDVGYLADLKFTVPEPQTWLLATLGLVGIAWIGRRAGG